MAGIGTLSPCWPVRCRVSFLREIDRGQKRWWENPVRYQRTVIKEADREPTRHRPRSALEPQRLVAGGRCARPMRATVDAPLH